MNGFQIRVQPVVSLPLVIAVTVILLALLLVRPRHVALSAWQWGSLIGLRVVIVLLMLVAMLRPALVYSKVEPVAASLIMLIDDSRSMQVADSLGDKPRWDVVHRLLESAANDLAKLNHKLTVSAYEFDGQVRKLNMHEGKLELSAAAEGEESAIGAAITESLEHETNKRVLATILLSDGAQRAVPPRDLPPQVAARRLKAENIPIYTFVFGKPGGRERADLSVSDLVTNETIFSEAPTEVRAQLAANGYANQRVKVQLLWESKTGMEVVDTAQVDTGAEGAAVPVVLHYTAHTPGEYKVTVRVEPREGELVTTNNEVSTFVTVRAGGINVLYLVGAKRIGGGPGQEQRFVRAALAHSPDIVVDRRLIKYEPAGLDLSDAFSGKRGAIAAGEDRSIARTRGRDVVVLDDVDVQGLSADTWKALAQHVRTGMGLIMLGGYHSFGPGGFRDSPLADVLPIQIGPAQRQAFGETPREDVQVRGPLKMLPVAPLGTRHPILQLSGSSPGARGGLDRINGSDAAQLWDKLPPLDGANRIGRNELKPNAQVLAEGNDPQRSPLLIAGQSGEGRVLAFAGDSTWHWQMAGFGEAHRRFWRQCVLWLAKKDEQTEGRVWIRLAGRRAMRGSRVEFNVGAENAQGEPVANAQFDVAVQTPDGKTDKVQPSKTGSDWSAIFRQTAKAGDYRIVVKAKDGNQDVGAAQARFLVPNQDLELDRPAAEPSLMAQLAETTRAAGGAALAPEELPDLLRRLAEKPPELKQEVIAKVTYWDTWPFFLAVVGLLGSEWYLRKRWGLV